MPTQVTVTADTGPATQNTAVVFTNLTGVLFLPDRKILQLFTGGDTNSPPAKEFDLEGVTAVTCTISGDSYAFVVS